MTARGTKDNDPKHTSGFSASFAIREASAADYDLPEFVEGTSLLKELGMYL